MSPLALAKHYFELSNKSDLDAIRALMTESTTYSSENTGLHLGVDQIMAMQENFHGSFEILCWHVREVEEIKPGVVRFEFLLSGKRKSGEAVCQAGIEHIVVHEGKLQHIEVRNASAEPKAPASGTAARRLVSSGSPFEAKIGYSRALVDGAWCFVAGSTGLDVESGKLPESVEEQCRNTLRTIETALAEAGFAFKDVVRVHYILPDRRDFEHCWPQLQAAFGQVRPPATMIQAELLDPKMRIEIEVTAYDPAKA